MTAIAAPALACTHVPFADCWMCSDAVSWWREARLRAGYSAEPPNRLLADMRRAREREAREKQARKDASYARRVQVRYG